jgi:hypothetical protein
MAPPPYLECVLAFTLAVHAVHAWLDLRQRRELLKRAPPPALAAEFGGEKFAQARRGGEGERGEGAKRPGGRRRGARGRPLGSVSPAPQPDPCPNAPPPRPGPVPTRAPHPTPPPLTPQIRRYALDKWALNFCRSTYHLGEQLIILGSGALPWLWSATARAAPRLAGAGEVPHTVAFALAAAVASALLEVPWSAYSTFVVEARNGFNKTTPVGRGVPAARAAGCRGRGAAGRLGVRRPRLGVPPPRPSTPTPHTAHPPPPPRTPQAVFVADLAKSLALTALLAPPLVAGVTWILLRSGPWLPLQLWGFVLGVALVLMAAYPTLIAPLFNK